MMMGWITWLTRKMNSNPGRGYACLMLLSSPPHQLFDLPDPREDENPADVIRSNIINIVGLVRILGGMTPEEDDH